MERGPLLEILTSMIDTDKELTLILTGEDKPMEIRNVQSAEALTSAHGIKLVTRQNYIWLDASHVNAAWQARADV